MKKVFLILSLILISGQFLLSQVSHDGPDAWSVNFGINARIYAIVINPQNQSTMYFGSLDSGVYKSINGGVNWVPVNTGLTYNKVQCLAISKSNPNVLYAGTDQNGSSASGVYVTTNAGTSWTFATSGISDPLGIQSIAIHPTNPSIAFACAFDGVNASTVGLWKTTNMGTNWTASATGITLNNILSVLINPLNPNVVYAGSSLILPSSTGPSKIFKSYDGGNNWVDMSNGLPTGTTTGNPIRALSMSPTDTGRVLAALFMNDTTGGAYLTTNGGQTWNKKWGIPNTTGTLSRAALINPLNPNEMFIGLDQSSTGTNFGVWRTTNGGTTWADFSGGALLSTYTVRSLAFRTTGNPTLFAGGGSATVVAARGTFEYTWTAVGINNPVTPVDFNLSQNYPNPFNPSTNIKFDIPKSGFVRLAVYDITGREVALLINEQRNAGTHAVNFNASGLSSGVYIYRLESGNFITEKRMILIK